MDESLLTHRRRLIDSPQLWDLGNKNLVFREDFTPSDMKNLNIKKETILISLNSK